MKMSSMYREDQEAQKALEGLQAIAKLEDEADVVLEGGTENVIGGYNVVKPEGGFEGIESVDNPYVFAQEHDVKVLVKHGDGTFERFNHES